MNPTLTETETKGLGLAVATYTVADLAKLLGVSERHIHRLRDQKKIPGELRAGRCVRFSRAVIDRWLSGDTAATR